MTIAGLFDKDNGWVTPGDVEIFCVMLPVRMYICRHEPVEAEEFKKAPGDFRRVKSFAATTRIEKPACKRASLIYYKNCNYE